jgi:hypothetical protein
MATEVAGFGGLSLVKKDGSHSQRFPLVERRYLFGRYMRVLFWDHGMDASLEGAARAVVVSWLCPSAALRRGADLRYSALCGGCGPRPSLMLCGGRADYCDIRINLLTVSREHAEIVVDEKNQVCHLRVKTHLLGWARASHPWCSM